MCSVVSPKERGVCVALSVMLQYKHASLGLASRETTAACLTMNREAEFDEMTHVDTYFHIAHFHIVDIRRKYLTVPL